jgi:hypothetical protein
MSQGLHLYRDDDGCPRASARGAQRLLAAFLETDLQQDAALGRELRRRIAGIRKGETQRSEFIGNAHAVSLSPAGALLTSQFDPEAAPQHFDLDLFDAVVLRWIAFIETRPPRVESASRKGGRP